MVTVIDYPPDLPLESIKDVIRILRSGTIVEERQLFAKQVWIAQGYFQNVLIGNTPPLPGMMILGAPSEVSDSPELIPGQEIQGEVSESIAPAASAAVSFASFPALTDDQLAHALETTLHKVDPSVQASTLPIPVQLILENLVRRGLEVLLNRIFPGATGAK